MASCARLGVTLSPKVRSTAAVTQLPQQSRSRTLCRTEVTGVPWARAQPLGPYPAPPPDCAHVCECMCACVSACYVLRSHLLHSAWQSLLQYSRDQTMLRLSPESRDPLTQQSPARPLQPDTGSPPLVIIGNSSNLSRMFSETGSHQDRGVSFPWGPAEMLHLRTPGPLISREA